MSPALNEDVVQRVNDLGTVPWSGTTYRHVAGRRDPLSGSGAQIFGGRWNPKDSFNAIYLAEPVATCMGEVRRLADSLGVEVADLLAVKRTLYTLAVHDLPVLDLRTEDALNRVGLDPADIDDDDWTACQAVGAAAHFLAMGGVIAPSAVGSGNVLTAFESRLLPGQVEIRGTEPLTLDVYQRLTS